MPFTVSTHFDRDLQGICKHDNGVDYKLLFYYLNAAGARSGGLVEWTIKADGSGVVDEFGQMHSYGTASMLTDFGTLAGGLGTMLDTVLAAKVTAGFSPF